MPTDVNKAWEEWFDGPWLQHSKSWSVIADNLNQRDRWTVQVFTRGADSKFLAETWFMGQSRLELLPLGEMKARWSYAGYEDIMAKLNALTGSDSDLYFFPDNLRNQEILDVPLEANTNYALRIYDEAGNMARFNFDQKSHVPQKATIYTADAGAEGRRLYCYYAL